MISRLRLTSAELLLYSAAALLFLFCESKTLSMNDLGIYLAAGREMAQEGGIADVDAFTHTVDGAPFLNGTWGSQWVFFRLWTLTGYSGLQFLLAFSVCGTVLLAGAAAARAAHNRQALGPCGFLAAWLVVQNLGLRPQLFSLPLFAAYAALALAFTPSVWTIAASGALVAVWANLHGSFAIAPVLSGLIAAGILFETAPSLAPRALFEHLKKSLLTPNEARLHALTAAVAILGGMATPYGWTIYRYVAENTSSPASRGLTEWFPTSIATPAGIRLSVGYGVVALALVVTKRWPAKRDLPALLAFTFLSLTAIRHVVWLGMIVPIVAARALYRRDPEAPQEPVKTLHPAFTLVAMALWSVLLVKESPVLAARGLTGDAEVKERFDEATPVELVTWADQHGVKGNLFNPMEWGSWLIWRLPANVRLFVDTRIWIFPDDVWNDYLTISNAEWGWEDTLDRYQVDFAILDRGFQSDLIPYMEHSDRWEQVYSDDLGLIFKRRPKPAPP